METLKTCNFSQKLAFGQNGEHIVAECLVQRGCVVLGLYQFKTPDFAPYLINMQGKIVSPDLVCFKEGKTFLGEVKTKTNWLYNNNTFETGINLRHYNEYLALQKAVNLPLYLFFNQIERKPNGIFAVDILCKDVRIWQGKTPLAIFPLPAMKKIGEAQEINLPTQPAKETQPTENKPFRKN